MSSSQSPINHSRHLTIRLELHNPEDDVSARAAVTEGLEAAAETGRALDHEHILVSRILNNLHFKLFSYSQCSMSSP